MSATDLTDAHDYPTRNMTPEDEARLITVLAQYRAAQAAWHPRGCTCFPCNLRQVVENRARVAAAAARMAGAS